MNVFLTPMLIISSIVFVIGLVGLVINRKNLIVLLMCIELMLLAANSNFVAYARAYDHLSGEIMVFFVLAIAAAESAIGLSILVALFRHYQTIDARCMNELKG
ncbi:MAG: NADH-quinone oxidoreductase subunit NuoK [Legionellales bacterium]|nr:NADH-quinone oxidoreductase subunit NuoK [Legionellales bacterium]|tara:strand:- start:593 stop:901 length:309 start_codon:yes stop_codon:yes gene_type:complete